MTGHWAQPLATIITCQSNPFICWPFCNAEWCRSVSGCEFVHVMLFCYIYVRINRITVLWDRVLSSLFKCNICLLFFFLSPALKIGIQYCQSKMQWKEYTFPRRDRGQIDGAALSACLDGDTVWFVPCWSARSVKFELHANVLLL